MPVRLVVRNFPPHVDAAAASAHVAQATAHGAPLRCETLYYRRGKAKTKRGVRFGSLYVDCDDETSVTERLARAGLPPPVSADEPPPPPKRPPLPLFVERAAFDRTFGAPRPDRRAGTWRESPEFQAFLDYDPRKGPRAKKADTPVALLAYLNTHGSIFRRAGIGAAKKPKKKKPKKPSNATKKKKKKTPRNRGGQGAKRPIIRPPAAA